MGDKMNKKQLIILWIIGISLSIVFMSIEIQSGLGETDWSFLIRGGIPILIIGSLLIYTFRKK